MSTAKRTSEYMRVDRLDNGKRRLVRDLVIDLGVNVGLDEEEFPNFTLSPNGTTVVTVPAGFVTDFSSIPAFARALYRFDSVDLAACCHDLAYRVAVPRGIADRIWEIVATSGERRVGRIRGWLGRAGLRVGGWFAYNPTGHALAQPN